MISVDFRKDLLVYTSYVNRENLELLKEDNVLPVFIARNIKNSELIGKWQGTPIHLPELSPNPVLLRDWKKYKKIDDNTFKNKFMKELSKIDLETLLTKLDILCHLSCTNKIALLGYGEDIYKDHRFVVSEFINNSFLLNNRIKEYEYRRHN